MSDEVRCPKCGSNQLTANKKGFSGGKAVAGAVLTGGIGLLAGTIGSNKINITCLSCGKQFMPGEGVTKPIGMVRKKKQGGCFVATACYGDYNSPEVLILRHYRDHKLLKSTFGRVFVEFYYFFSPALAVVIGKSSFLKKGIRKYFLSPIVNKLKKTNY